MNDDDEESVEVLPDDDEDDELDDDDIELSDAVLDRCLWSGENIRSTLLGGVNVYGGEEKLELSEEHLSKELPMDDECKKGFGRRACCCAACHSPAGCSEQLSWITEGAELLAIFTSLLLVFVEGLSASDLSGKWLREKVSLWLRESKVTVNFGGPETV